MTKNYLGFFLLAIQLCGCSTISEDENNPASQPTWIEKTNIPGPGFKSAVSFNIQDNLYILTGQTHTESAFFAITDEFWKYDYVNDFWELLNSFPGGKRTRAIAFSVNGFGYIGMGYRIDNINGDLLHVYLNDLWRFNPSDLSWEEMAELPSDGTTSVISFTIDDLAYIVGPNSGNGLELWVYNPILNEWTEKAKLQTSNSAGVGFSINKNGYVIYGEKVFEYVPISDSWSQKRNFPGQARVDAIGFSLNAKGFLACGVSKGVQTIYFKDIWVYDQALDEWNLDDLSYPGSGSYSMIASVLDDQVLLGLGEYVSGSNALTLAHDLWEFNP